MTNREKFEQEIQRCKDKLETLSGHDYVAYARNVSLNIGDQAGLFERLEDGDEFPRHLEGLTYVDLRLAEDHFRAAALAGKQPEPAFNMAGYANQLLNNIAATGAA